jgi:hypothetical protein
MITTDMEMYDLAQLCGVSVCELAAAREAFMSDYAQA